MKRVLFFLLVALAAAVPAATAAAKPRFTLSRLGAGGAPFPARSFLLNFPDSDAIDHLRVHVTENGRPVSRATVTPAFYADSSQFAVVLVIDTSISMRGKAIENGMAAARAFAARLNPQQKLAVVTFDEKVRVLLPFTKDPARINTTLLGNPTLAYGSHIYDALWKASQLFKQSGIESGSIILLSDGADVRSRMTRQQAAGAVAAAHAQVYSVGLRSRSFDPETLRALAKNSGGSFAVARSPDQLPAIYDSLGFRLASSWILQYRSLAGPKQRVRVVVRIDGFRGKERTSYVSPALPAPPSPPYHRSLAASFWRSSVSLMIAILAAAALLAGALLAILSQRGSGVPSRVAEFVSISGRGEEASDAGTTDSVLASLREAREAGWWKRFVEELEISEISLSASQIVALTAAGMVAVALILLVVSGPLAAVIGFVLVPLFVRLFLKKRLERRRRIFSEQLADNLAVVSAAIRAGHSLVGALSVVIEDAPEPARGEFRRIVAQEQLGVPLEDSIDDVARRMACRDLEQVSIVAAVGRESGGNTAEVLDRVVETVRERSDLRRLVRTLTAQGRMSRWVVTVLPAFLLGAILVINPKYVQPLFDKSAGRALLGLAVLMVIAGSLAIRRIVDIKV